MKALVKYAEGPEGMGIRDIPVPEPKKGEVRLAIKAAGICGTDLHSMKDERKTIMPVVLGHEFVGVIDKLGEGVTDYKLGDWVTGLPACYSCGTCEYCKRGEVTLCHNRKSVGTHKDGAMAEYMVMPAKYCYKVPDDAEDKLIYAAAEPMACAVRAIYERINVYTGELVVVSGPGTIGLFLIQALKSRGAYVIASGLPLDAHRLKKALEVGADEAYDNYEDLEKAVKKHNPEGADLVCEATGVAGSLDTCFKIVRIHGTLLQVGVYGTDITCNFNQIFNKELTVTSTNSTATSTWDIAMKLIEEKKIDLASVVSLRIPLENWKEGFEAAINKSAFKVILIP